MARAFRYSVTQEKSEFDLRLYEKGIRELMILQENCPYLTEKNIELGARAGTCVAGREILRYVGTIEKVREKIRTELLENYIRIFDNANSFRLPESDAVEKRKQQTGYGSPGAYWMYFFVEDPNNASYIWNFPSHTDRDGAFLGGLPCLSSILYQPVKQFCKMKAQQRIAELVPVVSLHPELLTEAFFQQGGHTDMPSRELYDLIFTDSKKFLAGLLEKTR